MSTILSGAFRLGRDAEKRETESGSFLSLSLAYEARVKGEPQTQWVRATLGGTRANAVADHLLKGTLIFATLRDLHVTTYKGADGEVRYALEGRILDFDFLGAKKKEDGKVEEEAPAEA